jgi:capsular polysaccharide transport system ATP-binding protein
MIKLINVFKQYSVRSGSRIVLNNINFSIDYGEKVGILGKNGAGKSTLIRLISEAEQPTNGQIIRDMSVSWPIAFGGAFQGSLTGIDNLYFICRIYGIDAKKILPFIEEFTELGKYLREPIKKYSSGMRARLAFAISMAVEFDCFLIDEVVAVGDHSFHQKCHNELFEKRKDRAMIIVSHDIHYIKEHCTRASVLKEGKLINFDNVDSAFEFYYS